jgi:hypothetical protein
MFLIERQREGRKEERRGVDYGRLHSMWAFKVVNLIESN